MEEKKNDAYESMMNMMEQKKNNNELKKISEVEDVEKEIENKVSYTEEELYDIDAFDRTEVISSMEVVNDTADAKEIDIDKINVSQRKAIDTNRLLHEALKASTSTFEIVVPQSGYSCKIAPLTNRDSFNILNSSSSEYENNKTTYKVIYSKIREFSCGQMTFDQWLKNTTVADLETFYYGLYCATFLDEGAFKFTCPDYECGHETTIAIRNKSLVQTADFEGMKENIKHIEAEATSFKAVKQLSLLSSFAHIQLPKTKFIFELKMPSLYDLLDLYKQVDDKVLKNHGDDDINTLLCINGMLIPEDNGNYVSDIDKNDFLQIIDNLPVQDAGALRKAISEILEKNHVYYTIKSVKCAKCGKEIKNIPINLRSILFTKIYAMR